MPTYAELNQKHPSIDVDEMADHEALYRGGKVFKARLDRFLPQWDCEPTKRHELRKRLSHYRNYLGAVIDYFTALLFAGKATAAAKKTEGGEEVKDPDPYYGKFRGDCDGLGQDLELFFKERLTEAMVHRVSWFLLRHPEDDAQLPAQTLAEYEERKVGDCTLSEIPVGEVYDWECDGDGELEWVLVHSKSSKRSASLVGGRSRISERWALYQRDHVDVFGVDYEAGVTPVSNQAIALVPTEGYAHRFGCVPVLCLELKTALWAANKLSDPQLAHFRASNAQSWSLQNSAFALMLFTVGDPEAFSKVEIGAGRGIVLKDDEDAKWIAPPGEHFAALDTDIKAQKDEIFRLAHQMALGVENNAAALGRSADSKASDSEATRVILEAYGEAVVEAMERIYDMISAVRGDRYVWSIDGLGDFASADIGGLLTTLEQVDKIGGIPSTIWKTKILTKIANTTGPDLTEDDKVKIAKQIEENIDAAEEHALAMKEAQIDGLDDPEDDEDPKGAVGVRARGNRPPPPARGAAAAAG